MEYSISYQAAHSVSLLAFRGDESHEQFRTFIVEELQALKSGLALATQAREQSDDEIIHVSGPIS